MLTENSLRGVLSPWYWTMPLAVSEFIMSYRSLGLVSMNEAQFIHLKRCILVSMNILQKTGK